MLVLAATCLAFRRYQGLEYLQTLSGTVLHTTAALSSKLSPELSKAVFVVGIGNLTL